MSLADPAFDIDALPQPHKGLEDALIITTEGYEGPLHLLLEMARKQKLDLLYISIEGLADQYLAFIKSAKTRRIDLAADYLLMAAWLVLLKSRLLLPKREEDVDADDSAEDMSRRLAFRLKRLEAMREAATMLKEGPQLGQDIFLRGDPQPVKITKKLEYDTVLFDLSQALGQVKTRKDALQPHRIERQIVMPLENARQHLKAKIVDLDQWQDMTALSGELIEQHHLYPKQSVTASLLSASLELTRDGELSLRQSAAFSPIFLRAFKSDPAHIDPEDMTRAPYD